MYLHFQIVQLFRLSLFQVITSRLFPQLWNDYFTIFRFLQKPFLRFVVRLRNKSADQTRVCLDKDTHTVCCWDKTQLSVYTLAHMFIQGRNFGLKSGGVPIQKENKASLGPEARAQENGEEVPLLMGLGKRHELSKWVPKMVLLYFKLRRSLLLTAGYSKFFTFSSWKVGVWYPSVQKVGVPVPLVLRLSVHRRLHTASEITFKETSLLACCLMPAYTQSRSLTDLRVHQN